MAIARGLGHVPENTEALLDGFLALPRHVSPSRQYIILNVIALLRGHLLPDAAAFAHVLLLLGGELAEALPILQHTLAVFGAEALLLVAIASVIIFRAARILARRRTVRIHPTAIDISTIEIRTVYI